MASEAEAKLIAELPHFRNLIVHGVPTLTNLDIQDFGKALCSAANLSSEQYTISQAWPGVFGREEEIRITFITMTTGQKFLEFVGYNLSYWNCNVCAAKSFPFQYGDHNYELKFVHETFPNVEELFTKALQLKLEFDGLTFKFSWLGDKVEVFRNEDVWQLKDENDLQALRRTIKYMIDHGLSDMKPRDMYYPNNFSKFVDLDNFSAATKLN